MDSARQLQIGRARTGDWSAIIVNYNGDPFLPACLEALGRVRLRPKDVFVVDNASTDGSLFEMNGYPWAEVVKNPTNLGFAGGANTGLRRVETSYAVILNPDVEVAPDFGEQLVEAFGASPRLGAAGTLLTYPDGETIQHAGGRVYRPGFHTDHLGRGEPISAEFGQIVDIDYATGAALVLRMEAAREVGGFDETLAPVYYEDVDLSTMLRKHGWDVQLIPTLRGLHHEGVTLDYSRDYFVLLNRNRYRYAMKHLSSREWFEEFVPWEIARIRHDLAKTEAAGSTEVIGIEGLDMLLRQLDPLAGADAASIGVPPYPGGAFDLAELDRLRVVGGQPSTSRVPLIGRLWSRFLGIGARRYVDEALLEQRAFNDAVMRALTIQQDRNTLQDHVNREQTAALMLFALVALRRLDDLAGEDKPVGD